MFKSLYLYVTNEHKIKNQCFINPIIKISNILRVFMGLSRILRVYMGAISFLVDFIRINADNY